MYGIKHTFLANAGLADLQHHMHLSKLRRGGSRALKPGAGQAALLMQSSSYTRNMSLSIVVALFRAAQFPVEAVINADFEAHSEYELAC